MSSLRDLGLSEYEARAYRSLLETGPTTAKELSRASDVPMGRIYDVLNSLETYNLVRSQTASRPKKYVAVEPDTALDRLLEDKKRELQEKVGQYEEIVADLSSQLESAEPVEEPFWTAAVGPNNSLDLLLERLAAADDEIIMVGSAPARQVDILSGTERIVDELEAALERGVEVSLLVRPDLFESLPEEANREYYERLFHYDNYSARASPNIRTTFELLDGVEVCIEVPHPLGREETFGVIDMKDSDFTADIRKAFEEHWAEATPVGPP
ncbi:TrmB family transcriptional regulator [Haloarcula sp. CBA1130]|uniref:TrmB family transcriptional regulator n=1 Tax=unclassified Haloarcula TaxID=2624677 RepID=UPI001246D444|nr:MULTISPECIES: TrmB family transcriptional regulator [unclassified Haloarcula]KAA9398942.1 TrmB family transcriptional regulator [Haloarcula sp. CBA1129]KAA9403457.1 TrmB family transcriptional regulator [Haloarcula sp. CBA1130]